MTDTSAADFDPQTHHDVLDYLRELWAGKDSDPEFESTTFGPYFVFNTLNLAALIFAVAKEREIPLERVLHFLRIGIPGGGDQTLALLIQRIASLAEAFDEREWLTLLYSGVVGDPAEIGPIRAGFDQVGMVVKYCHAIDSLRELENHDAIDARYGFIDEDPGWE